MRRALALLLVLWAAHAAAADPVAATAPLHLFILSGQSNMANLKPEETFIPALQQALGSESVLVVKVAVNGQQIRRWLPEWRPPADLPARADGKPVREEGNGQLYRELLAKVATALDGKPRPASVTFVWMQGEADARAGYGAVYEASLRALHDHLVADLARPDLNWVIGRISDYGNQRQDEEPDWQRIRTIQVAVATSTPRTRWVDGDDLNGDHDGLHYPAEGYRELGRRFAKEALALIVATPPAAIQAATPPSPAP